LLCLILIATTAGCGPAETQLRSGNHTIEIQDPHLGKYERRFVIDLPADLSSAIPLVLGFHGQSGSPEGWGPATRFVELARASGWAIVFPAAVRENTTALSSDSTWNCGTAADNSTCLTGTTGVQCMKSCARLGQCGTCTWATCYDDVAFIQQLLASLEQKLCLDAERYFLVGESNGGMLIHSLIQHLPGVFAAAVPAFASPLLGYLVGDQFQLLVQQKHAAKTSILQLHDRSDTTIPWQGGASNDGWIYESRDRALGVWAAVHGCNSSALPVNNEYTGGPSRLGCWEYPDCMQGHVMYCMYDGAHGDWPDQPRADNLVWSFFQNVTAGSATY